MSEEAGIDVRAHRHMYRSLLVTAVQGSCMNGANNIMGSVDLAPIRLLDNQQVAGRPTLLKHRLGWSGCAVSPPYASSHCMRAGSGCT
eukprot:93747-Amphidinium_carterae.1